MNGSAACGRLFPRRSTIRNGVKSTGVYTRAAARDPLGARSASSTTYAIHYARLPRCFHTRELRPSSEKPRPCAITWSPFLSRRAATPAGSRQSDRVTSSWVIPARACVCMGTWPLQRAARSNVILIVAALNPENGPFVLDWFLLASVARGHGALVGRAESMWWARAEHLRELESKQGSRAFAFWAWCPTVSFASSTSWLRLAFIHRFTRDFGFPVVDSLMHGAPVLCSFKAPLEEFDCPGVHYFDPVIRHLRCRLADGQQQRLELPGESYRTSCYSWDRLADKVLAQVERDVRNGGCRSSRAARS